MSFVYYSIASTEGPPLIAAQASLQSSWTSITRLNHLIQQLNAIDFSDYSSRRVAIQLIRSVPIPPFAYTYPFDPLSHLLSPPFPQTRFPSSQTFVLLTTTYQPIFNKLSSALSYRDSDGSIDLPKASYLAALTELTDAFNLDTGFFDRATWELLHVLIWALYPPVDVVHLDAARFSS
jgi:hypothetical protein